MKLPAVRQTFCFIEFYKHTHTHAQNTGSVSTRVPVFRTRQYNHLPTLARLNFKGAGYTAHSLASFYYDEDF